MATRTAKSRMTDERTLTAYAESLGTAMGALRNHVDGWKSHRQQLIDQLSTVITDAQTLLADLGHAGAAGVREARRQAKKSPSAHRISAAGRAAIAAAQKARWAAFHKQKAAK